MRTDSSRASRPAVLIYRIGQLGDTLVALPAIQAIADMHRGARRVLLTDRHKTAANYVSAWDVLKATGWIDEVEFYDPSGLRAHENLGQVVSLAKRLRAYHFSTVYNLAMRTSPRTATRDRMFFRVVTGAREYRAIDPIAYPPPAQLAGALPRMVPEWKRVLDAVAPGRDQTGYRIPVSDAARRDLASRQFDAPFPRAGIVVAPGSKMPAKCWPEERFVALGRLLLARCPGVRLYVVGGTDDKALGDRLCAAWEGGENWAGRLSIYGTAALMEQCSLFVGNDTGTMHLAAMVGLPCVGLFSARDYPGLWEPYGEGHAILRKEISCAGCMLESCAQNGNACLKLISVDEVLGAVTGLLRDAAARGRSANAPPHQMADQ
jgi:heptosyltransferase III